jgi:hypothetical protein
MSVSEHERELPIHVEPSIMSQSIHSQQIIPYHRQMPPYGRLGNPYLITKHDVAYTEKYAPDTRWSYLQKETLTNQLNKCFPFVYVITHSLAMTLHSLVQIALQITLLVCQGALASVAQGIWGGVYFLVTAIVTILLSNQSILFQL